MYAREFLESGNAIKANPAIAVLRTTRRFLLFLFVLLLLMISFPIMGSSLQNIRFRLLHSSL